jgi:hypothetical protein
MKKTGENMLTSNFEEVIAVNNPVEHNLLSETHVMPLVQPQLQAQVNSMIHEHLTDMWLLVTGEEAKDQSLGKKRYDGKPFAMVCGGQMRLLESRPFTLDALRVVGIEMS